MKWNDVEKACGTRSVWTVDLAFALRALGCRDFLFLTKTTGCDPSYARLAFYRRDLGADSTRIQSLFRRAQQGEVSVKRAVATRDGLLEVLRTGRVLAIALVDLRLLHARAARTSLLPRSYTGHYVLLVGAEGDRVRYRDPAADRAELVIDADERLSAPQALEHPWFAASHEPGTDPLQGSQSFKEFNAMRKLKSAARKIVLANGVAKEWRARARS